MKIDLRADGTAKSPAQVRLNAGVTVRVGRSRTKAFRDDDFRISGSADATTRVTR